jgi:AraC-like DNA-binding protein
MAGATVSCKTIRAALAIASAAGLDPARALAPYNLDASAVSDPDARFGHEVWTGLWRDIDACGPGPFGLRAAQALAAAHFDLIDYIFSSSRDLGAGLAQFARYFALVSTGVTHVVVPEAQGMRLERHYALGAHTDLPHPAEFAFACVVLRSRAMTGVAWRPRAVHFAHRPPLDDREHRELFDCPLQWDAKTSAIVIDGSTLSLPMRAFEPELHRLLARHAEALVAALPTSSADLRARAKETIVAGLRSGHASVADVAKKLGLSDRTLQRRLGELGTSHAKLLDEARSELVMRYLGERSLAMAEVAFLLGFNDVTAFHRAFRRWSDRTPAQHRRDILEASASPQ